MLDLKNETPFKVALVPGLDQNDVATLTVVIKSTWSFTTPPSTLVPSERQRPILWKDEPNGEDPAKSSVRFESDAVPLKPGTDVLLVGHAHPLGGPTAAMDVHLRAGPIAKSVRVFGERRWVRAAGAWVISPPLPFETMPLVYERAFGGMDTSDPNPQRHAGEERNPVGAGFVAHGNAARLDELPLPNLEDPRAPVKSWKDRPAPAGFGVVARGWLPRRLLAGTYDDAWQEHRCPLLPSDFDERFFNAGPVDQIARPHLQGGEQVSVVGAWGGGDLQFALPRLTLEVSYGIKKTTETARALMDTVMVLPEEWQVIVCWRHTLRCGRRFLDVKQVRARAVTA